MTGWLGGELHFAGSWTFGTILSWLVYRFHLWSCPLAELEDSEGQSTSTKNGVTGFPCSVKVSGHHLNGGDYPAVHTRSTDTLTLGQPRQADP
jgi:hypothetical protein